MQNAIVIMFDSLQHNYLGCYGNTWIKTPNFDRFAREGVLFENCYIEGVPTVPCRRAMHTGRYTLPVAGWVAITMDDTTIADLCWGRPIDTAIIFDCPMYRLPKFGYTRGFDKVHFFHGHEGDHYFYMEDALIHLKPEDFHDDHIMRDMDKVMGEKAMGPLLHETASYLKETQYWKTEEDQRVVRVIRKACDYLRQVDRNKQFYLWVDSFDPHEPWDSPSVYDPEMECPYDKGYKGKDQFLPAMGAVKGIYTEAELNHVRMLYAEKVAMCDKYLGELLDCIRALGLEENTLVMIVSDHGEPMGNGEHGHGIMRKCRPWPYEELVHAPMWLRAPGVKPGQRIAAFVQSVDVAPTVCDWLGIGVHPDMQGKSLLPLVRGEVSKLRDFAIAGYNKFSWAIYTEDWSYIHWVKNDEATIADSMFEIYGKGLAEASQHLDLTKKSTSNINYSKAEEIHKEAATLDGEEQWTCTPGAISEVPARDELYNRKTDKFQLHNVIDKNKDVAQELLKTLRTFMSDLKNS